MACVLLGLSFANEEDIPDAGVDGDEEELNLDREVNNECKLRF